MILSPNPIFNTIIEILIQEKSLKVKELHSIVSKKESISLPNFYKIIAQLLERHIVRRHQGHIEIHNQRIHTIDYIHQKLIQQSTDNTDLGQLKPGSSLIFTKNSLKELDNIRSDAFSNIMQQYDTEKTRYCYNAHQYHILGMIQTESYLYKKLSDYGKKDLYFLIGSNSYLDLLTQHYLQDFGCKCITSAEVPFASQGHCINVYGDHYIEVVFPLMLSHYFQDYYDKTTDISHFDQQSFTKLFDFQIPIQLKITHDANKAQDLRNIIASYF